MPRGVFKNPIDRAKKISNKLKGIKRSTITKEKIRNFQKGRKKSPFSNEHKRKMSEAKMREKNPNWIKNRNIVENNRKRTAKEWYLKNKKRKYKLAYKLRKQKRKSNPSFRLYLNISSAISVSLRGKKARQKWQKLVGYSIDDLIRHLEKQFDDKMNWENYGSYWWIDHIKPRSLFKYENAEDSEFQKCWALRNLQPLEKIENIIKRNKYCE